MWAGSEYCIFFCVYLAGSFGWRDNTKSNSRDHQWFWTKRRSFIRAVASTVLAFGLCLLV